MAKLYLPNVIAEAAVTSIALQHGISRSYRSGFVLATEREIASAIRRACRDVLGDGAWLRLPPELSSSIHASEGSAESGAPHVSAEVKP